MTGIPRHELSELVLTRSQNLPASLREFQATIAGVTGSPRRSLWLNTAIAGFGLLTYVIHVPLLLGSDDVGIGVEVVIMGVPLVMGYVWSNCLYDFVTKNGSKQALQLMLQIHFFGILIFMIATYFREQEHGGEPAMSVPSFWLYLAGSVFMSTAFSLQLGIQNLYSWSSQLTCLDMAKRFKAF